MAEEIIANINAIPGLSVIKLVDASTITIECTRGHVHDYVITTTAEVKCKTCSVKEKFPKETLAAAEKLAGGPFLLSSADASGWTFTREVGGRIITITCKKGSGPVTMPQTEPPIIVLHQMPGNKITPILRAFFTEHGVITGVEGRPAVKKKSSSHKILAVPAKIGAVNDAGFGQISGGIGEGITTLTTDFAPQSRRVDSDIWSQ